MANETSTGFFETVRLVVWLRFKLFARRMTGRGAIGACMAGLLAIGISVGLGIGTYLLFSAVPAIVSSPVWLAFSLGMVVFLLGLFWVIWPVVAAQVDEAYELGRFFHYPVRPLKLYLIQSLAALFEPSVLFFYPPLIGMGIALSMSIEPGTLAITVLTIAFVLMNIACGRCLQNLFLNLMTSRRSGEILLVVFLLLLGLAAFIPPVDASWLYGRLEGFGSSAKDLAILAKTARALGSTPPGWLAYGLAAAAAGHVKVVAGTTAMMLFTGGVCWLTGLMLLKRFYRGGKGWQLLPSGSRSASVKGNPLRGADIPFISPTVGTLFVKELKTLARNPKARLLFAVPFFLLIILKIIGAPQLFAYLWGEAWAAIFLCLLGLYVLSVLSGQFFANGFGYDGSGIRQVFLTPAASRIWFVGRNLAQAAYATLQFTGLAILLFFFVPDASGRGMILPLLAFPFSLVVSLGVGNLLSVRYPRSFRYDLSRRDRPVGASFFWMLLALTLCALMVLLAMLATGGKPSVIWFPLLVLVGIGAFSYRILLRLAARWLSDERESLIFTISG